jgi:hypothetical protein
MATSRSSPTELRLRPDPLPAVARAVELAVTATTHGDPARLYESRWRLAALVDATAGSADPSGADDGRYGC